MAHRMFHRRNPEVLGVEMTDVAWATGGLSFTAVLNDKVVAPLVDKFVPTLKKNALVRKLVDGGTTLGVAYGGGKVVEMVDRGAGKWWQIGGSILGLGKGVTAFVPNYQLSSTTPIDNTVSKFFNPLLGSGQAAPQLGAGAPSSMQGAPQTAAPDVTGTLALNSGVSSDNFNLTQIGGDAYSFKGGA